MNKTLMSILYGFIAANAVVAAATIAAASVLA